MYIRRVKISFFFSKTAQPELVNSESFFSLKFFKEKLNFRYVNSQ